MQVTWNGDEDALAVLGGIEDAKYGYSENVPFAAVPASGPADLSTDQTTYASPGIMVGGNGCNITPTTNSPGMSNFSDTLQFCSTCCESGGPGCTSTASRVYTINGFPMPTQTITQTCTTATVTP